MRLNGADYQWAKVPPYWVFLYYTSVSSAILANTSLRLGKKIRWDGDAESLRED